MFTFVRQGSVDARERIRQWRKSITREESAVDADEDQASPPADSFLPGIPPEVCISMGYLVEYLVKNKLHKNELFLLDGKPQESKKLLKSVQQGDQPTNLGRYSSRTISFVVRHLLTSYAPLLPYDYFDAVLNLMEEGTPMRLLLLSEVLDEIESERRALLECLLRLLYALSLKARSNAQLLGETIGATFARPSEANLLETFEVRRDIGIFLIETAPLIFQQAPIPTQSHIRSVTQSYVSSITDYDVKSEDGEVEELEVDEEDEDDNMQSPDDLDESGFNDSFEYDDDLLALSSGPTSPENQSNDALRKKRSTDASPQRLSVVSSPKKSVTFATDVTTATNAQSAISSPHTPTSMSSMDATMMKRLLTVIISSPQKKRGLFVKMPPHQEEIATLRHLVSSYLGKSLDFLPLESFSVLAVAIVVRDHIQNRMEPLFGYGILEQIVASFAHDDDDLSNHEEECVDTIQQIFQNLPNENREILRLLFHCTRQANDAGTSQNDIENSLLLSLVEPLGSSSGHQHRRSRATDKAWTALIVRLMFQSMATFFSEKKSSIGEASYQRTESHRNLDASVFIGIYWIAILRIRSRRRKAAQLSLATVESHSSEPLDEESAALLCVLVEELIDRTRGNHVSKLYVQAGDSLETKIIYDSFVKNSSPNLMIFSLFSIAMALKKILSDRFAPLIPFFQLVAPAVSSSNHQKEEDGASELNVWRFEAIVMKELPPMKKKLIQLLFVHLDLIAAKEPSRSVLKELFEEIAELLFCPPLETRARAGEFCARILRARFFVAKTKQKASVAKQSEHRVASILTMPAQTEDPKPSRRATSPAQKQPLDLCIGPEFLPSKKRERLKVNHSTEGLDLKMPPATLSELLLVQHSVNNSVESISVSDLPIWVDVVISTRPDLRELLNAVRMIGVAWQSHANTISVPNFELRIISSIEFYELLWSIFVAYSTTSSDCVIAMSFDSLHELCIDCAIIKSPKENRSTALLHDQSLQELYEKANGMKSSAEIKGLTFQEFYMFLVHVTIHIESKKAIQPPEKSTFESSGLSVMRDLVANHLYPFGKRSNTSVCPSNLRVIQLLRQRMGDLDFVGRAYCSRSGFRPTRLSDGNQEDQSSRPMCDLVLPTEQKSAEELVIALLRWVRVPSTLISEITAVQTLQNIMQTNREQQNFRWCFKNSSQINSSVLYLELIEALTRETTKTLSHESLSEFYPTELDCALVLLDVWGIADRAIVTQAA